MYFVKALSCDVHFVLNALAAVPAPCTPSIADLSHDPVTPVGPATITDALLLLVFCDICSSSLSLSFESLDSILISNFHYYFEDGRPTVTRYYNHKYYKPYNIYDYNRRTWQDHRHHIYRRKAI